jgi:threonine/homoserine/homoserine lactone efflux protein
MTVLPDGTSLALFLTAALVLVVVPGPAVLYIVARSVGQGRVAGVVSTLGVATGTVLHSGAAALGLSAVLVSSALAFEIVKYLGAAYLVLLGMHRLLTRKTLSEARRLSPRALSRIFGEAVVVNVLNPKTALFFFAFLPQFVDVGRGSVGVQIFALGGLFAALGVLSDGLYALTAGSLGEWLGRRGRSHRGLLGAQRYLTGTLLVALGLATALTRRAQG